MRRLILQEWLTLDGFAADANNEVRFLESTVLNKYSDQDILQFMEGIDTILLGANTYQLFVDFWPDCTTDQEVIADKLNSTPKIIFSKTLQQAPWGKWTAATVIQTDAVAALQEMKTRPGKDMVLWGSISLAQSFMKANLVDEYHFRICPLALGSGRRLFDNPLPLDFELFGCKQYEGGLVLLQYRRK